MKKILAVLAIAACLVIVPTVAQAAQNVSYTVQSGDSLWKIAVKFQAGISELVALNPQLKNPSMIYPGQKLIVPNMTAVTAQEDEVIRLVNVQRAQNGLPKLTKNWQLSRVARYKSQDMINKGYFSHSSPTYGSPFRMIESFGLRFSAAGENIAMGQQSPQAVMNSWMNSSGHRANILNPSYTQIGVGLAKSKSGVYYWTQQFIKPY